MLKINYVTPKNTEIAKVLQKSEAAVRQAKRDYKKNYEQMLFDFKFKTYPFVSLQDYMKKYDIDQDNIESLSKESIVLQKEEKDFRGNTKNSEKLIPYNLKNQIETREDFKSLKTPKVISITNRKGGVAKTTNSINISSMLALLGYDVLFVDYDTQANASQSFGLRPKIHIEKSIIDIILEIGKGADDSIVKENIISLKEQFQCQGKFDILPNMGDAQTQKKAKNIARELQLYSTSYKALDMTLEKVKHNYDFVIIDTPPNDIDSLTMVTMATDYFILSYRVDERSIEGAPMLIATLKEELEMSYKMNKGGTIKILAGIISDYEENINQQKDIVEQAQRDFTKFIEAYNFPKEWKIFPQKIKHLTKFGKIQIDGYGSLVSPSSLQDRLTTPEIKAIRDYMDISSEIVNKIIIDSI